MEQLLNSMWLLVSVGLAVWALLPGGATNHTRIRVALALCCVLVILFPVISMTDDLQFQQIATEDANGVRKLGRAAEVHHSHVIYAPPQTAAAMQAPSWHAFGLLSNGRQLPSRYARLANVAGRAPPYVL